MNTSMPSDSRDIRESGASDSVPSWDPYEVWLTRVQQPRERSRRNAPRRAAEGAASTAQDPRPELTAKPTPA